MGVANAITVLVQLSLLCFPAFGDAIIQTVPPTKPHHYVVPAPAPSHHHHRSHPHVHPPSHAPVHPPTPSPSPGSPLPHPPMTLTHPPIHPPKPSPPHPPVHPPKPSPPRPPVVHPHPPVHSPSPPHPHPFPRSFVAVQGVIYCKSCKYAGSDTLLGATPILGATIKLECNNTKYPLAAKATTDKNGYFFLEAPKKVTSYGAHKCKVSLVSSPLASCSKPTDLRGGVTGGYLRPEKPYVADKSPFVLFNVGPFAFAPKCPL